MILISWARYRNRKDPDHGHRNRIAPEQVTRTEQTLVTDRNNKHPDHGHRNRIDPEKGYLNRVGPGHSLRNKKVLITATGTERVLIAAIRTEYSRSWSRPSEQKRSRSRSLNEINRDHGYQNRIMIISDALTEQIPIKTTGTQQIWITAPEQNRSCSGLPKQIVNFWDI
jgi:hypothetical protein